MQGVLDHIAHSAINDAWGLLAGFSPEETVENISSGPDSDNGNPPIATLGRVIN